MKPQLNSKKGKSELTAVSTLSPIPLDNEVDPSDDPKPSPISIITSPPSKDADLNKKRFTLPKLLSKKNVDETSKSPATRTPRSPSLSLTMNQLLCEVTGLCVFVNKQLILKVWEQEEMETAFHSTNQDFKETCLDFLNSIENDKKTPETKNIELLQEPYTLFSSTLGDKEIVFLVKGSQEQGFPLIDTIHASICGILNAMRPDGNKDTGHNRRDTLIGLSSIEEVFRTIDLDGSGTLDLMEFSAGLKSLGVDWDDSSIAKLFQQIDEEQKETISYGTFMKFMMKPTNKKKWKELKRAIQDTIATPSIKNVKDEDVIEISKKLSDVERLVDMMEEAMVEQGDPGDEVFWRNKLSTHREFIRRYQDVVGRGLRQRVSQLKVQHERINELESELENYKTGNSLTPSPSPKPDDSPTKKRQSNALPDENQEELVKRLRRETQELKRKMQAKDKELKELKTQSRKSTITMPVTPTSTRKRLSTQDDEEVSPELLQRLKKENRDLRNERDTLRKERDQLQIAKEKAEDKVSKLGAQGPDEDMEALLSRMKQENKNLRQNQRAMREEQIQLRNIDNKLRKKLENLAKQLADIDEKLAHAIFEKGDLNEMLEELADQLSNMANRYRDAENRSKLLARELEKMKEEYEEKINQLKNEIELLKNKLREKDEEIKKLAFTIKDKDDEIHVKDEIIAKLKSELQRTEEMYSENKLLKRRIDDLQDEILEIKKLMEQTQAEAATHRRENQGLLRRIKLLEKMPGTQPMIKKIERLYKIFKKLDKNEDDKLHFEEFAPGATELGFGDTEFEIRKAFGDMDKDGDGYVEFEDFKDACLQLMEGKDGGDPGWKEIHKLMQKPPKHWGVDEVSKWLDCVGLAQYQDGFRAANIDGRALLSMRTNDLRDLGVTKSMHIKKIMKEIEDLQKRDDMLGNLKFETDRLKQELDYMKEYGPTWDSIKELQQRVRNLEGQLRKERHARENIMDNVRKELENDKKFLELSNDQQDTLAEIALLKGALSDANKTLNTIKEENKKLKGEDIEIDNKAENALVHDNLPIGRFLQKWYVLANHNSQYWVSPTNSELELKAKQMTSTNSDQQAKTEGLNWILYDTRRERVVHEVRVNGRGLSSDPKDVKIQMSVSSSGPWTDVAGATLKKSSDPQFIQGFEAKGRFWRVLFLNNHGENHPDAPRYVLNEVQFWGPLDDDVENNHFVIE